MVAPIAWFPIPGRFAPPATVPAQEAIAGLTVLHPRSFYLPKIGRPLNPWLFGRSLQKPLADLRRTFPFDVIFVNWAYPDACGVAQIARVPFVVSISGSDANWYLTMRVRRRQILTMLGQAHAITVRSQALKDLLVSQAIPPEKIHVLYNGVDTHWFTPIPKTEARRQFNVPPQSPVLLYVGRLSPEKGVADLLQALAILRHEHKIPARLLVLGDGPQREALWQHAVELDIRAHIHWAGWKKPDEVPPYLSAADLLCLPSHMEGVPNAALEAFACGLPVVATKVGGTPEVVTEDTGVLTEPHNPQAFATALSFALQARWNPQLIRQHAAKFDWNVNATRLHKILQSASAA
ncbi:MAG: putative teichuronic acid biosynthesis glycosyltransferase TuaC [Verrucomicrobiae bacterium]|nr:putative teichuronic acid biosynthesis glycosyltransferase TuaC [Verrucomicrobiae bacterium]